MDWNKILNWKLLSGSHKFPGPDGGTCINEAAIVAAGFKYHAVSSAADCPPCFSRVLSSYALVLNDRLSDDRRQELLMPFVTRLAGTKDTPEIERQRIDFIMLGLIRTVLPISLRGWNDDLAAECERVTNYNQAIDVANKIARDLDLDLAVACARTRALPRALARALARDVALDLALDLDLAVACAHALPRALAFPRALDLARALARALGLALDLALDLAAVSILDGAIQIGKQADPIDAGIVVGRLAKIRQLALSDKKVGGLSPAG